MTDEPLPHYYRFGSEVIGPVSRDDIQALITAGTITAATGLRVGDGEWHAAGTFGFDFPQPGFAPRASNPIPWGKLGLIAAGLGVVMLFAAWPKEPDFSPADIREIQDTIKAKLAENSALRVESVELIRKAPRELVGFARIGSDILKDIRTVDCTATMAVDGKNYIWKCHP